MSEFVTLKDVKKIYQMGEVEIMAAAGIDFEIKKGEFAVVVGPSGAGKTTVLNILGGMDTASEGQICRRRICLCTGVSIWDIFFRCII